VLDAIAAAELLVAIAAAELLAAAELSAGLAHSLPQDPPKSGFRVFCCGCKKIICDRYENIPRRCAVDVIRDGETVPCAHPLHGDCHCICHNGDKISASIAVRLRNSLASILAGRLRLSARLTQRDDPSRVLPLACRCTSVGAFDPYTREGGPRRDRRHRRCGAFGGHRRCGAFGGARSSIPTAPSAVPSRPFGVAAFEAATRGLSH